MSAEAMGGMYLDIMPGGTEHISLSLPFRFNVFHELEPMWWTCAWYICTYVPSTLPPSAVDTEQHALARSLFRDSTTRTLCWARQHPFWIKPTVLPSPVHSALTTHLGNTASWRERTQFTCDY
ncbi:hypothetical protein BV25DRAFT_376813 [Artomyces pyxidatus]|uniref:Uncharacterized protein n=1 Tax=Artomyces pyxidatus TaxID=48021 RepID=A0ACB8SE57_9AGAM|nr:hypothetical protein BV25DRAFT_376813 [Artomyces pyxidatus]